MKTSTNFTHALAFTLKHEGGWVSHSKDPGGATNYGISLRFLKGEVNGVNARDIIVDMDGDGDFDIDDIKNLTPDIVRQLYYEFFWSHWFDNLEPSIAIKTFDMSVNMGRLQGVKLLQLACNKLGNKLLVDGRIGPATIAQSRCVYAPVLMDEMCHQADLFYHKLVAKKPALDVFLKGWLNRAYATP